MKGLFVAIALLLVVVAEGHHLHEHTLRGPRYLAGKVHVYDVEFNVTAGVQGLSSQVSKSAFKAELQIFAKSGNTHILKVTNVYTSGSVKATDNKNGFVSMEKNLDLEKLLSTPIKFTMENGEVTSYTLSPRESLESKKIKKAILRSLEMYVPETALQQMESSELSERVPVFYNITKGVGIDQHTAHYLITVSPDIEFPYNNMVYNISRSENFEAERYQSHKFHHNFRQQGCSSACRMDRTTNEYGAGCPPGYEPHQSPMKTYVHHQHHLALENDIMTPETIRTVEVHTAKMYDQDMEVLIRLQIKKTGYSRRVFEEPTEQPTYTNLKDQEPEIDENEIEAKCENRSPREVLEAAKVLLTDIAKTLAKGDLETEESTLVGEKIILLKSALSKLKASDLKIFAESEIPKKSSLRTAKEEIKIKRPIWMDLLPLIGTPESVSFIVSYIKENIDRDFMLWEVKEILDALPLNIHEPSEKVINELRTLLTLSKTKRNHLLFSAAHLCIARVISSLCNGTETVSSVRRSTQQLSWFPGNQESFRKLEHASRSDSHSPVQCPIELVSEIVQEIVQKLKSSQKKDEIIIFLEFLSQSGVSEALPVVSDYAYGTADNLQYFDPSYIEFVKSAAIFSLHSVVERHPEDVLEIVVPLFFNETESPKIRTAAFGVLIRGQPSLEILKHVAVRSWSEKSNEVGSFVTSSMDTFGNNTLPCMQLTAHRIRQVMPMLRRFDIGLQHAKNLLWSYFDDFRMFGVGNHLTYTPSNASIFPSAIYYALSYSTDSLSDTLIQLGLNIQGLTQEKIFNFIDELILGVAPVENIPSSKKNEIFEQAKIVERIPESLRFTFYKRFCYSSAYYYLDLSNMKSQFEIMFEYVGTYLMKSPLNYSGHIVKVFLPSSLHTVTIAKSLPYPVEFQMQQPVVLAMRFESKEINPFLRKLHFVMNPSFYVTKLITNQLKNVGDCKEMGVYHEHKMSYSHPLEIKFEVRGLTNVTLRYKIPELPKKVLYYFSESGTYAGRKSLETLASSEDRMPIRTLPSAFKNSTIIDSIGLPPYRVETHTEEIGLMMEDSPSNLWEILDLTVRGIMNAGWRYKAANITFEGYSSAWPKDTEATYFLQYNRNHVSQRNLKMSRQQDSNPWPESESQNSFSSDEWMTTEPEEDDLVTEQSPQQWFWGKSRKDDNVDDAWREGLKPDDIPRIKNPSIFAEQARRIASKFSSAIPHIRHVFNVGYETSPVYSSAYMKLEYNHTHTKSLHSVHVETAVKAPHARAFRKISLDHLMGFSGKPDEFQYDAHSDDHSATFITALRSHPIECSCPWKEVEVIAKGEFQFEPLDSILNHELESSVERKFFMSEQHDQCVRDINDGEPQSMSCLKAIKEQSIYNKLKMSVLWRKELPKGITNLARRFDTFMKHIYYNHMSLDYHPNAENKIDVTLNHIDKLTDKPVFDMTIRKPEETITFRRMRTIGHAVSSVHDVLGVDLMELTNNTYPPTCIMMEKSIKTYDLKYYPLSLDQCSYILSTHCTENKNFAIISKTLSTDGLKEIHFHVGPHTLIMSPRSGDHFTIKYDDQDHIVSEPIVFDEDTEIYAFSERYTSGHRHLEVVAHKAGVRIIYDGKNVKIQIHPRYKGETCGLCSEFDGEIIREYRGVDKCLYSDPDDFVNSAITNREVCKKQATHPYICEEEANMVWRQTGTEDRYKPSIKRNVVLVKGDELCFSVRALPVCESNSKPVETEFLQVGFHCLPKQDLTARRMVSEAKRRSLGEIENKSIDYEENIEVATMC